MDNSNGFNQPIPGPVPEPTPQPVPPVQPAQPAPEPVPQPAQPAPEPMQPIQPVQPVQPVQPMQPNPMQPVATPAAAPKPKMDAAKKRNIIIGCCIGGGCLIITIIAIVLALVLNKPDYQSTYDKLDELSKTIYSLSTGDCYKLVNSFTNTSYTNITEQDIDPEPCKAEVAKIYTGLNELGETSGVKKDSEVQKAYNDFKTTLQENIPEGDALEKELKTLQDVYNFASKVKNVSSSEDLTATRGTITEALSYLTNSENEKLVEVGKELSNKFDDLFNTLDKYMSAAEAYQNADVLDPNYSDIYKAYTDAYSEMSEKSSALSSLSSDDFIEKLDLKFKDPYDVSNKFNDLRDIVWNKLYS